MSTAIRRDYIIDLVSGNRHPGTVHLNFVVVADHTTLGRPTIHQIAARASVISFECRVESLMPFIVAYSVVSFLRCRVSTEKHNDRAANKGDTMPSSKVHSITSSARGRNDVDNSTPNHLNIPVSERDYNINPRFSVFIGFVLHDYADNDFRIFCARLRPFALNNFRLFDLSEQAPHEYPS